MSSRIKTIDDFDVKGKTTLVRVDFNSPVDLETKRLLDDSRIKAHAETILTLSNRGARVVIMAHQGRLGDPDFTTLKQHAEILSKIINKDVKYVDDVFGEKAEKAIKMLKNGEILVLENVRVVPEEVVEKPPEDLAKLVFIQKLSSLADLFVNDAFGAAHRAHASIVGFAYNLPACAGRIMEREIKALTKVSTTPEKPCIYILGGEKVKDSFSVIEYILGQGVANSVLTGGLVACTLLLSEGVDLGDGSVKVMESKGVIDLLPKGRSLLEKFAGKIKLPTDVALNVAGKRVEVEVDELPSEHPISDVGSKTAEAYVSEIKAAKSIVFNGPLGICELEPFKKGTHVILEGVAASKAYSVAGGGHTTAVIQDLGFADKISYISTGGHALIQFLTGKKLPGVEALKGK